MRSTRDLCLELGIANGIAWTYRNSALNAEIFKTTGIISTPLPIPILYLIMTITRKQLRTPRLSWQRPRQWISPCQGPVGHPHDVTPRRAKDGMPSDTLERYSLLTKLGVSLGKGVRSQPVWGGGFQSKRFSDGE